MNPYTVIRAAEQATGKPARIIRGRSRMESVVSVRDACILLIHEHTSMTSSEIAVMFDRHRSSISYSIARSIDRLDLCHKFAAVYADIKTKIQTNNTPTP